MTSFFDWTTSHPGIVFLTVLATVGVAVLTAALIDRRNRP